ncbi:hypothetical protein HO173_000710 [Letharia columbiana]|uniref:Folic acid synthesis protein FOL1 n=1 Tax=Letharia columbiana TaxID=112416 RepID=A0A8H6L9M0_9LECA|nr:uncharacterized protein HO173_000710 [Letharia columbiana]KAF6240918.1 hypothetical protein HO173_000710 [Letharia columbiana]
MHHGLLLSTCASSLPVLRRLQFGRCLLSYVPIQRAKTYDWRFSLRNIRLDSSRFGPRANPNFYRTDVYVPSPPGCYYVSDFRKRTAEVLNVVSLVRTHATPVCSIHDITESLASDLLATYPAALETLIVFQPDIRNKFKVENLIRADCSFSKVNPRSKRLTAEQNSIYRVTTEWHLPSPPQSGYVISLVLQTVERSVSTVYGHLEFTSSRSSLAYVHPTFGLHEEVARFAEQLQSDRAEGAALLLAQCLFHLADKQSPCKRLQDVRVVMREVSPLMEGFRTKREAMVERLKKKIDNDYATGCSVHLVRHEYERSQRSLLSSDVQNGRHRAYLALGSNLGNRVEMIESAVRQMSDRGITVLRTSALYETKPMYLENQQSFINGACEIETSLSPLGLLDQLKLIEHDLGRVKTVENGPRTIDLDILLYDEERVENLRLSIPHKRMLEREFVLRPLCDLIPDSIPPTPDSIATYQDILEQLPESTDPLSALTPLSDYLPPIRNQSPTRPTHLMAILNLTPDSFSDGGLHSTADPIPLLDTLRSYTNQRHPVTILDVGGQSTRPHAPQISPDEELSRILPTIEAIRSDPSFQTMAISIDTYRASVAAEAIKAGADIINDVSSGQLDPEMLPTIAKLGCTCILMHMRGTPETMKTLISYPDGVINGVGNELLERVRDAEKAGIRRWRIMLDPGIGFAKTQAQSLELLRRFSELRDFEGLRGFPWVVGASRKGFIGKITGVQDARERKWGTATTVAAAIQGGADIVRVHDVSEMGQVVAMADAIWRV